MSFQVGETIGRYRIIEQLGQGGMATVFKAYHAELDRYVALKVLHPAFLEDPNFLARFQREARLVAKMDHPNIVPIYDYAEHEGRPYLVMKFIEGETLKARLERGSLSRSEVGGIVDAVGLALGYAHKQGILHRDMKPSNVLIATDGHIYLADFGLARIAQSGESTLTSDMIVGTPQYISPEQALGKKDLDAGTDIYSFGVMLYELAVGKVPFSADTPFSIIHDHIYTPLPLPRIVNPGVPEEVERVLLKALAKERADRQKDVKTLVASFLEAWQSDEPDEPAAGDAVTVLFAPEAPEIAPVMEATPVPAGGAEPAAPQPMGVEPPKKKRKISWVWLAVIVILIMMCLVVLGSLQSWRALRNSPTPMNIASTLAPLQTPKNLIDIGQAQRAVDENPDDPMAHLQLALAYQQADILDMEQASITQVLALVGTDEGVLWDASRMAAGKEAWLSAARLAVEAVELHFGTSTELPGDQRVLFHETVYKSAKNPLMNEYIAFDRLARLDEPFSLAIKARYTFFKGDWNAAQEILDELLRMKPDYVEAQLLQAEFSALSGDVELAAQVLSDLRANPGVQGWMLQEAEVIEEQLP